MALYTVLNAVDATRLLKLHPRREGSEIRCSLITTFLSTNPTYTALSYEWGDVKNQKTISLNGHEVSIRANLWRFLSRISHEHDDRVLWIDAISINQSDIAERNQQVQMMAQIYKSASAVWVWLGDDSGNVGDFLRSITSAEGLKEGSGDTSLDVMVAVRPDSSQHKAIVDISKRSYFTRTWIVQELLLAQELLVYCGENCVDWDALLERCWKVLDDDSPLLLLAQARNRRKEHESIDGYATLISDFGSSQCTDIHDKVYGLLGLLPEYKDRLRVDYAVTIPVLFFRTLSLFEEARKARSAEHLRRYLGLTWPQLYSVRDDPSQPPASSTSTDSPTSIRLLLQKTGPATEVEQRRQLFPHGPGQRQPKPNDPRRKYFTFRIPPAPSSRSKHTYGLSTCRPLPSHTVCFFLELHSIAVIFRKNDAEKHVAVGGVATSANSRESLSLLAEAPDHGRLAVLQDGLWSGVEATGRGDSMLYAFLTVKELEGILTTETTK